MKERCLSLRILNLIFTEGTAEMCQLLISQDIWRIIMQWIERPAVWGPPMNHEMGVSAFFEGLLSRANPLIVRSLWNTPLIVEQLDRHGIQCTEPIDNATIQSILGHFERSVGIFNEVCLEELTTSADSQTLLEEQTTQIVALLQGLRVLVEHREYLRAYEGVHLSLRDLELVGAFGAQTFLVYWTVAKTTTDPVTLASALEIVKDILDTVKSALFHRFPEFLTQKGEAFPKSMFEVFLECLSMSVTPTDATMLVHPLIEARNSVLRILKLSWEGKADFLNLIAPEALGMYFMQIVALDYGTLQESMESRLFEQIYLSRYVDEWNFRYAFLNWLLTTSQDKAILAAMRSGLLETLIVNPLTSPVYFDVQYKVMPETFMQFNRTYALRREGIRFVEAMFKYGKDMDNMISELCSQFIRQGLLLGEKERLWTLENKILQTSVLELLWVLLVNGNDRVQALLKDSLLWEDVLRFVGHAQCQTMWNDINEKKKVKHKDGFLFYLYRNASVVVNNREKYPDFLDLFAAAAGSPDSQKAPK